MIGGIYSDQKCPACGSTFNWDPRRDGLFCPKHREHKATGRFRVAFGRAVKPKRFKTYERARKFLGGLQFEVDHKKFDSRDYQTDRPLAFDVLADQWLEQKKKKVKPSHWQNLKRYIFAAVDEWGDRNIKTIREAEIEDFLWMREDITEKTRNHMRSALHDFWEWLRRRRVLRADQIPEFPDVPYELGLRKPTDKETQKKIMDEVYRLVADRNVKIWLGINILASSIGLRPGDLINANEGDFDLEARVLWARHPKDKRAKPIPLRDDHIELIRTLPRGLPHLPFFRHGKGFNNAVEEGQPFGPDIFYRYWKRAAAKLGVHDVDLYAGTIHTSARGLKEWYSPEEIKRAMCRSTSKAFWRYFDLEESDIRDIYEATGRTAKNGKRMANAKGADSSTPSSPKLLKFRGSGKK